MFFVRRTLMKIAIVILMISMIGCASAELIPLHNYTIDTGSYLMPIDYQNQDYKNWTRARSGPEVTPFAFISGEKVISGWAVVEGFHWRYNAGETGSLIAIFSLENPAALSSFDLLSLRIKWLSGDPNNAKLYETNLPYPGWITSFRDNNTQVIAYAGTVCPGLLVTYETYENSTRATQLLKQLKIIPPGQCVESSLG